MTRSTRSGSGSARAAVSGVVIGLIVTSIDGGAVATALPTVVEELGGLDYLPWLVTGHLLATTVVLPIYGGWSDTLGRKPLFIAALAILVGGAALAATATSIAWLIGARTIQGLGAGGVVVLAQAMIADTAPPRLRGRYLGLLGALFSLGAMAGPVLGGVITDQLGWRWVFALTVPIGVAAIVVGRSRIPPATPATSNRSLDILGATLLTVALSGLVLGIVLGGGGLPWSSPVVWGLFAAAAVVGTALLIWERRVADGVVPVGMLAHRDVLLAVLVAFISGTAIMGLVVFTPVFLQVAAGASPTQSGLLMLPLMLSFMVSSILTGQAITRLGRYKLFPVIGTLLLAIGFWLLAVMTSTTEMWFAGLALGISGAGVGMVMQVIVLAVQNMVPGGAIGSATSLAQLFRSVGATIGVTVFGSILNARLVTEIARREVTGSGIDAQAILDDPGLLESLDPGLAASISAAVGDAVTYVFAFGVPISLAALVAAVALRERPLGGVAPMLEVADV